MSVVTDGARSTFETDLVVHAAGRAPDLDALDLDTAGVARRNGRLDLDEHLRSRTNPHVYAAGDAASRGPQLTPIAALDARVVTANMLGLNEATPDYAVAPSAVFTIPPLARVGLLEEEARRLHPRIRVTCEDTADSVHVAPPRAGLRRLQDDRRRRRRPAARRPSAGSERR